jgi:hypothetical protein
MMNESIFFKIGMGTLLLNRFAFYIVFLLLCFTPYSVFIKLYATQASDFLYPIDSNPFGIPQKVFLAEWWKSNLAISAEDHPNFVDSNRSIDNTKDSGKCFIGEDKVHNVLFLGVPEVEDKFPVRTCDVPAGKAIFLPIESSQCDYGTEGINNENDLISCAKSGNDGVAASVSLDGIKADYQVEKNRIMTDPFNVTMNNRLMGDYTGTFGALSEGYSILVKPLTVGDHKLNYVVSVVNPANPVYDYFQNATYNLIAK